MAAVHDAAKLLKELGHEVEEARPEAGDLDNLVQSFTVVWSSGCASEIDMWAAALGKPVKEEYFEPVTWALYQAGKATSGGDYLTAVASLQSLGRAMAKFQEKYDVWLTPTLASPPPPIGYFDSTPEMPMIGFVRAGEYVPFTPISNASGQPAMSVPLFWNGDNLPIGTHYFGRFGDEATLFRLAAQLEEARPWANKRPPVSA